MEKQLGLSAEQGLFRGQPPRALGNMLGPPAAGLIIYVATIFTWLGLAAYGFKWKVEFAWWRDEYCWLAALTGYVVVGAVVWFLLWRWLRKSATGGLPKNWKTHRVELPPIELTYEYDDNLSAAKKKAAKLIDATTTVKSRLRSKIWLSLTRWRKSTY